MNSITKEIKEAIRKERILITKLHEVYAETSSLEESFKIQNMIRKHSNILKKLSQVRTITVIA